MKKRQYYLEINHKPVLTDNGKISVSFIMWKAEPYYESEIKYSLYSFYCSVNQCEKEPYNFLPLSFAPC